jgi:cell division protease FtsH
MALPTEDRYLQSKTEFEDKIAGLLGGNVAERLVFGDTTTGASNDIEKATEIARAMVCQYGMSDLGPLAFGKKEEQIFLGREIAQHRDFSEETAIRIDQEVRRIVDEQYARATKILEEHRDVMDRLVEALLENESLDSAQIRRVIAGLPVNGDDPAPSATDGDGKPEREESKQPFKKPILPPITPNNPATA